MRRWLAGATLALIAFFSWPESSTPQMTSTGGGGSGSGTTSLNTHLREYPYSGTLCITVDDGLKWVYTNLYDTLQAINADSMLTGTPGAMRISVFINMRGENALDDPFWNADGANLDPSDQLTVAEVIELSQSGVVGVGSHGYKHGTLDPDGLILSPFKPTGFRYGANQAVDNDSTAYAQVVSAIKAMRDTLGITCDSFVSPGHRMTTYSAYLMNLWGVNACRAGGRQTPRISGPSPFFGENWPDAATGGLAPAAWLNGKTRELNRQNTDMAAFQLSNFSGHRMECYLPFSNINRLWLTHIGPPTDADPLSSGQPAVATAEARQDSLKAIAYHIASTGSFGVLTWHDERAGSGSGLGNIDGVAEVLRYCAGLCRNTAENRDGPRLQLLTLSQGTAKHVDWRWSLAGQSFDVVNNFMLKKDAWRSTKPYGFHEGLEPIWSDSNWTYVDSVAAAANALFGPHGEGGLFRHTTSAAPTRLVQVFAVPPGATVQFGCLATADSFAVGGGPDSISAAKIEIEATFLRGVPDPTDTLLTWARNPIGGAVGDYLQDEAFPAVSSLAPMSQADWTGNTVPRWSTTKMWGGFHWQDQWRVARTITGSTGNNWWFLNDDIDPDTEYGMRWRTFYMETIVPGDARIAVVHYRPVGFTSITSDTICISGITCQVTP